MSVTTEVVFVVPTVVVKALGVFRQARARASSRARSWSSDRPA
jgi:hypothetical protein